jgi:hypothetical protein
MRESKKHQAAARREVEVICKGCGARIRSSARLDSLGFLEITCPHCLQPRTLPLKWGYRITYWVFLGLSVYGFALAIQSGNHQRGIMSVIWGAFILVSLLLRAILKDFKILYQQRQRDEPSCIEKNSTITAGPADR